jgi:hypothetical protein
MEKRIIQSRNKREGGYAGCIWGYNISYGRGRARHQRAGGHSSVRKCISLKVWKRLAKGGCSL